VHVTLGGDTPTATPAAAKPADPPVSSNRDDVDDADAQGKHVASPEFGA
jgi:hypothetical protein